MKFVFKEISAKTISLTTLSLLAYNNARYDLYRDGDDESSILMWLFRSDSYDKRWTGDLPEYKDLHYKEEVK